MRVISLFLYSMKINFSKYQGTGNDFVMLDNRNGQYDALTIESIVHLCDRRLGIGADGLIKISSSDKADFRVEYYNSDGSQSFCGNGARCSVMFAHKLGVDKSEVIFDAIDGIHRAEILGDLVKLEMLPVTGITDLGGTDHFLDTGSPHFVRVLGNAAIEIVKFGKEIRYGEPYKKDGVNVNTLHVDGADEISVETYERGVEDETLSCGTGVTACALVYMHQSNRFNEVKVHTKGGDLSVLAKKTDNGFDNIWLIGPAKRVFDGVIDV